MMAARKLTSTLFFVVLLARPVWGSDFFEREIRPILVDRCLKCHGEEKPKGEFRLTSREAILQGGSRGPSVDLEKRNESVLLSAVLREGDLKMPPDDPLSKEEVAKLQAWIRQGVPWPTSEKRAIWWRQPPAKSAPPAFEGDDGLGEIDRYLLGALRDRRLRRAPTASRPVLLRRVTFGLTGLPPTPEETAAFVADTKADAWHRVVERLLNSPRFGERWGKHWLDLVRYADTAGEVGDFPVPQAYRYRNYVLQAIQNDVPYDRFLREQIAGDILAADLPDENAKTNAIVATGFVAVARRFGPNPDESMHLTIEDTLDTLGKVTLGLNVACARCHDHKSDPITQADYYGLYGIFQGTQFPYPGGENNKRPRGLTPINDGTTAISVSTASSPAPQFAYAVQEGRAGNARIQIRGDPKTLGMETPRRFLSAFGAAPLRDGDTGSGRLSLAHWITDPTNPLMARVMVNRIWAWTFGKGIVPTLNNFGSQGEPPTHPDLLDHLALRFVENGYSIKTMIRLLTHTQTYQLDSQIEPSANEADPANQWYWRFDRRRLDAEEVRDALLSVAGLLQVEPPIGPHALPPVESWNYSQHFPFRATFDGESNERSVYLIVPRLLRHPLLTLFDGADPNQSSPIRQATNVPTQTLFFLNSPFVERVSEAFAERLVKEKIKFAERVNLGYELAYGRSATDVEISEAQEYLQRVRKQNAEHLFWKSFARIVLTANEFLYVD